jgi:hypothetical protein
MGSLGKNQSMSIYRLDRFLPEWEPVPWPMDGDAADEQERGFHKRAQMAVRWQPIPWKSFLSDGIFDIRRTGYRLWMLLFSRPWMRRIGS